MASPLPARSVAAAAGPRAPAAGALGGAAGSRRRVGAAVALAAATVLGVAAWLEPAPAGLGTHERLGLPACGWISLADLPCPTCGMTTAFAHAANGDLVASFLAQPLGLLLAVATAMALFLGSYVAATGSRVAGQLGRLWVRGSGWAVIAVVLAAWAFKVVSYRT